MSILLALTEAQVDRIIDGVGAFTIITLFFGFVIVMFQLDKKK